MQYFSRTTNRHQQPSTNQPTKGIFFHNKSTPTNRTRWITNESIIIITLGNNTIVRRTRSPNNNLVVAHSTNETTQMTSSFTRSQIVVSSRPPSLAVPPSSYRSVCLAYQQPVSSTFLSEKSHQPTVFFSQNKLTPVTSQTNSWSLFVCPSPQDWPDIDGIHL
jgi:hypothetical protein